MKKWALAALIMLLTGCILLGISLKRDGLEGIVVNEADLEKLVYICEGPISGVDIDESSQDIDILVSDDGECRLEYMSGEHDAYDISFENGILRVKRETEFSIFNIEAPDIRRMRLYMPEGEYDEVDINAASSDVTIAEGFAFSEIDIELSSGDVKCFADAEHITAEASSGDLHIEGAAAGKVTAGTSSGSVCLSGVSAEDISVDTSSGEVKLDDVTASGMVTVSASSGDIEFARLEAGSIRIETASGDVEGSVVKPMQYEIETASGDVNVPVSMRDAALCRIETASGDIDIIEK